MDYKLFELLETKLDFEIKKPDYCFDMIFHNYILDEGFRVCTVCGIMERIETKTGYNRYFSIRPDKSKKERFFIGSEYGLNYNDALIIFERYNAYCNLDYMGLRRKRPKIYRGRNRVFLIKILIFDYFKNLKNKF